MNLHIRIATLMFAVLILAGGLSQAVFGQEEKKPEGAGKLSELTLSDLLNMQVITASKQSESSSDAPGIISVLTKDELERFGGTTLKDVLERVPGLIGSSVYMTDRSMIAARGDQVMASSSHILLLINGRPVREVEEAGIKSEMYESFPINIIDRIEVIKGPGSVMYGSDAFSGVINVITESMDKPGFSVSGYTDASNTYGALAKGKVQLGDANIIAAARIFKRPEWKLDYAYANPIAGHDTAVGVSIPDKGPGAYLEVNYKDLRFMSSFSQWDNFYAIPDFAYIFPAYGTAQWKKWFGDLGYKIKVSDDWNMDLNATYTRSTFDVSSWPNTNRDAYELVGEWTNFYRFSEKTKVVFGGLYNYIDGKEWGDPDPAHPFNDSHKYSLAGYAQVDYQVSEMVKLIGGLQANKVQGLDVDVNPRLGVLVNPTKNINVKALYSQAFRSPSLNELGLVHPAMMGKANLKPEKANTVDLGVSYTEERLYAEIDGFYSKMTNIIYQDRSGKYAVPTYDNLGEVTLSGIELEAKYYVSEKVFLTGSMLYQKSKNDITNVENVTPIASFGAKMGVSYRSANGVILSLFDIHQGGLDKFYSSQLNVSPGSYDILSLYFKLPLGHIFSLDADKELAVFVQADNLLDKQVWLPNWGLQPGTAIPYDQGRIIYVGLNFGI